MVIKVDLWLISLFIIKMKTHCFCFACTWSEPSVSKELLSNLWAHFQHVPCVSFAMLKPLITDMSQIYRLKRGREQDGTVSSLLYSLLSAFVIANYHLEWSVAKHVINKVDDFLAFFSIKCDTRKMFRSPPWKFMSRCPCIEYEFNHLCLLKLT